LIFKVRFLSAIKYSSSRIAFSFVAIKVLPAISYPKKT